MSGRARHALPGAGGVRLLAEEFLCGEIDPKSLDSRLREFLRAVRSRKLPASDLEGEKIHVSFAQKGNSWVCSVVGEDTRRVMTTFPISDAPRARMKELEQMLTYALNHRADSDNHVRDRFNTITKTRDWECDMCGKRFMRGQDLDRHEKRQHPELF